MATTFENITVDTEGLTVSLIVWRRFRRPTSRIVERIYEDTPGLAALGPILPVGTTFRIPIDQPRESTTIEPISLWT
jgi:phage tail protein X